MGVHGRVGDRRRVGRRGRRRTKSNHPAKGNVATFTFDGSAVALVGRMSQDGGRADVVLDGAPAGTLDAYIPPRTFDNDLWHRDGLRAGPHTVRIVTRDDANPQSTGKRVTFEVGIVYRAH